jgi:glycerol-3-phosphate acyltransferase PlsY
MLIARFVIVIILGYLLGSIPVGVIVARRQAKVDVLKYGSGKTGTTNVLRTAGKKAAAMVLIGDLLKGSLSVIFAGLIFGNDFMVIHNFAVGTLVAEVAAALAAVAGHNWSIFLKFKGGRGVTTFFGGLLALCPPAAIIGGEIFFVSTGFTKYVSFGSILGTIAVYILLVPLIIMYKFPIEYLFYALIGGLLIIVMHRDNITRLVAGTERKLGQKAEKINNPPSPKTGD